MKYLEFLEMKTPDPAVIDRLWKGSIDMHIHFAPDPGTRRRFDAFETAAAARDAGMAGIVLKSDHIPTIQTAYAVQRAVPEIRVFGSINIEECTGGLTEHMLLNLKNAAMMGAKVVWFPTFDAAYARSFMPGLAGTGIRILDEHQQLHPIVYKVLELVKAYDMVLASGHLSFAETRALFREACRYGITKKIATHPLADLIWDPYTMEQLEEITEYGCFIEHCYRMCLPLCGSLPPEKYVEAIRLIGAEHTILSTDFAQITDASPAEGMRCFIATMLQLGVSEEEIAQMVKTNPASLLDLQ